MNTRQDQLLTSVATQLQLAIVRSLAGGNFGACLVRSETGELSVLKALPSARFAAGWRQGSALCNLLHASAYPAPRYRAVGTLGDCTWSLQTYASGVVSPAPSLALALELATLAEQHRDRAPHETDFFANSEPMPARRDQVTDSPGPLVLNAKSRELAWLRKLLLGDPRGAVLLTRLNPLLTRLHSHRPGAPRLSMRRSDIVHGDFHALNALQLEEGRVSCIIDWEGAGVGDWRIDLANLVVTAPYESIQARLLTHASTPLAASLVAYHVLRYLAFDLQHRPQSFAANMADSERRFNALWAAGLETLEDDAS